MIYKILLCVIALQILVFGVIAFIYNSKEPNVKAIFWFKIQNYFPQGSVEEQFAFKMAIKLDSSFAEAYMEKSVSHNKRGLYSEGFSLLNKAVELDSTNFLGYRAFVKLYMLRDYEGAISDLNALNTLSPRVRKFAWGEDVHYLLGLAKKQLLRFDEAIDDFNKSYLYYSSNPSQSSIDPKLLLFLGISHLRLGEYDEAIENFDLGIEIDAKMAEVYFYKAIALMKKEMFQEAKECLKIAASLAQEGYLIRNEYYEVPDQVYLSDIISYQEMLSH